MSVCVCDGGMGGEGKKGETVGGVKGNDSIIKCGELVSKREFFCSLFV